MPDKSLISLLVDKLDSIDLTGWYQCRCVECNKIFYSRNKLSAYCLCKEEGTIQIDSWPDSIRQDRPIVVTGGRQHSKKTMMEAYMMNHGMPIGQLAFTSEPYIPKIEVGLPGLPNLEIQPHESVMGRFECLNIEPTSCSMYGEEIETTDKFSSKKYPSPENPGRPKTHRKNRKLQKDSRRKNR